MDGIPMSAFDPNQTSTPRDLVLRFALNTPLITRIVLDAVT